MTKIQGGGGSIAYRQTATQCQALRQAAGRWGTDLLPLQAQARAQTPWLSAAALEPATKGGPSALQRQSVQALCQILAATVETATAVARWRCASSTGRKPPTSRRRLRTIPPSTRR